MLVTRPFGMHTAWATNPTNHWNPLMATIKIIGAGLAGSECAFGLAQRDHRVELYEMRPAKTTAAHQTSNLAELVCSNSFRPNAQANAVGRLQAGTTRMPSPVSRCGESARVPA